MFERRLPLAAEAGHIEIKPCFKHRGKIPRAGCQGGDPLHIIEAAQTLVVLE